MTGGRLPEMVTSFFSAPRYAVIEYRCDRSFQVTRAISSVWSASRIGVLIVADALFCLDRDAETGRAAQIFTSTGP